MLGPAALTACAPADPPEVALCKFALARAVPNPLADPNALVTQGIDTTTVDLVYRDAGAPTTATCTVTVTRFAVRLRALKIGDTPVPDPTLARIRANWASKEDAGKLYQL
ncbi:hypothetical protein CKO28_08655 [Rhodovibrio sodomensis]|uniref:Uncharacterized protein n=1 Tax=Rhodovibrio sodomensis TaxID=1088 RepID=A0ABS1DFB6_9PROT|nr:hypothetical protein [Rhodovibrio sodomensis]